MQRDYFAILEIGPQATEIEIRAAYRRLARRYHPDLHPGQADAEARLKEINAAYEVLGDPILRARYLRTRTVHIRVDPPRPPAPPPSRPRPEAPPPSRASAPPDSRVYRSHVNLSGGQARYGGTSARYDDASWRRTIDDEDLALLYARRLLRALFGW